MTHDEKWKTKYAEVVEYMNTYQRNPSKHRIKDHSMLNWMKHNRKLMNKGELRKDRLDMFKLLLAKADTLKRQNQWTVVARDKDE